MNNKHPASENNITSPTTYGKEAYETYRKKEKHSKNERKIGIEQKKTKVVTDTNYAKVIAQLLKKLRFPINKNELIDYLSHSKSSHEVPREQTIEALSLLQQLPEKQYLTVADVVQAIDLVRDVS